MKNGERLVVSIDLEGVEQDVGELAQDGRRIYFKYYLEFGDTGLQFSPIKMPLSTGILYFGTRRFDRRGDARLHMHSASGLMHDNFRLSSMDYGHLMDGAFRLERHVKAYEKALRLAAFNVYGHNRDDHNKNVSFLMDAQGNWSLAPAYDLTFSFSAHGFHSMSIAGEWRSPGKEHRLELARVFRVQQPHQIIEQVRDVIANWKVYVKESGVERASAQLIGETLRQLGN